MVDPKFKIAGSDCSAHARQCGKSQLQSKAKEGELEMDREGGSASTFFFPPQADPAIPEDISTSRWTGTGMEYPREFMASLFNNNNKKPNTGPNIYQ